MQLGLFSNGVPAECASFPLACFLLDNPNGQDAGFHAKRHQFQCSQVPAIFVHLQMRHGLFSACFMQLSGWDTEPVGYDEGLQGVTRFASELCSEPAPSRHCRYMQKSMLDAPNHGGAFLNSLVDDFISMNTAAQPEEV